MVIVLRNEQAIFFGKVDDSRRQDQYVFILVEEGEQ